MHPEVVLFRKGLRAVCAVVLRLSHVDHLGVIIHFTFLREPHVADLAFEGFLFGVLWVRWWSKNLLIENMEKEQGRPVLWSV